MLIAGLYLPNGNPKPSVKFEFKLKWFERLRDHLGYLVALDAPVIVAGDLNVIPTDLDVYAPERWRDDALFAPEVRAAYAGVLEQGWIDALRHLYPDETIFTYWKYWRGASERDAGLRIDHVLLNPAAARLLMTAEVGRRTGGWEKTSDHAPVWIELSNEPARKPRRKP